MMDNRPGNQLLAAVPTCDWERMRPHFEEVELPLGRTLSDPGGRLRHLYFPNSAVVSHVAAFENGTTVEMATTGREGMVSIGAVLGSDTPLSRLLVQIPGSALAVGWHDFKRFEVEVPSFRKALLAFTQAFMAQVLQSVACNAVHRIEERAARWLLMCDDRSGGNPFPLTQEFLAEMLGVSRPTVSTAARFLQRAGLVDYSRGMITVVDRHGLEEASCECYQVVRRKYDRYLSPVLEANGRAAVWDR